MKSPISLKFVALGAANSLKGRLYKFSPARTGDAPDWDNQGATMQATETAQPITDKSYWLERYVLCELNLRKENKTLTLSDAIVALSKSKNIVQTQLTGMDGTVKEYINDGDYEMNIAVGVAAVENGQMVDKYPIDQLQELADFLDTKDAISVQSSFLDIFGVTKIVVKSYSLTQATEGNYQELTIAAVSDRTYNVYSTDY